jgi:hypothetical protein
LIDRRSILKYGLIGAAVLATGGVALTLQPTVLRAPKAPLECFDDVEYAILWALVSRLAPPDADALDIAGKLDKTFAAADLGTQAEFKQVLRLIENGLPGLFLDGRPRPFSAASPDVQDTTLERWRTSRISVRRTAFKAINQLIGAAYYASPETYAAVGYPGPPDYGNVR